MFEFKWHVPGPTPSDVNLRIRGLSGWLGRKVLTCDGHTIFRRGIFAGVEARFAPPSGGPPLHLRMVPVPGSTDWRPVLLAQGTPLPEVTGTVPPRIVPPPRSLAVPVGLTFLAMAIAIVMLPQLATILNAIGQRTDTCHTVLTVAESAAAPAPQLSSTRPAVADGLRITTSLLPPGTVGQPYETTLGATGGQSPYTWKVLGKRKVPAGLTLDADTGRIYGVPTKAGQFELTLRVIDDSYMASRDITRWFLPFVASAVCLLGFLAMRKWSVHVYGLLIVAQAAGLFLLTWPISITAVGVQAALWLLGVAHLGRMR